VQAVVSVYLPAFARRHALAFGPRQARNPPAWQPVGVFLIILLHRPHFMFGRAVVKIPFDQGNADAD
jgi:hypothetical protein